MTCFWQNLAIVTSDGDVLVNGRINGINIDDLA